MTLWLCNKIFIQTASPCSHFATTSRNTPAESFILRCQRKAQSREKSPPKTMERHLSRCTARWQLASTRRPCLLSLPGLCLCTKTMPGTRHCLQPTVSPLWWPTVFPNPSTSSNMVLVLKGPHPHLLCEVFRPVCAAADGHRGVWGLHLPSKKNAMFCLFL